MDYQLIFVTARLEFKKLGIGSRLREERDRLGLSQDGFAKLAGVAKNTAINWEKDASSPTADVLLSLAEKGIDTIYLLTGNRTSEMPVSDEQHYGNILDAIEDDLSGLSAMGLTEDQRRRLLSRCRETLEKAVSAAKVGKISGILARRAQALLNTMDDPKLLAALQLEKFAHRQRREAEAREGLKLWLSGFPYQPSEDVLSQMAGISVNFSVYHEPLVRLVQSVSRDIINSSTPR